MTHGTLTQKRLAYLLDYNPVTGSMTWKHPTSERAIEGRRAGTIAGNGRRYVALDNKKYMAHRLAWFYVYGAWPTANLCALNENYDDLRIANYVERTASETGRLGGPRKTSKSGTRGVSWSEKKGKWLACITHNYKYQHIGWFSSKEAATTARKQFELDLGRIPTLSPEAQVDKATRIAKGARLHVLWRKTLKQTSGVVGWTCFEAFAVDVGSAPDTRMLLVPIDTEKPLGPGNFTWKSAVKWDHKTSEGRHAYMRAHRAENRSSYRDKELRRDFGITLADYDRMHLAQNGLCACCREPEAQRRADGRIRKLAVDHCHKSGEVRELLCGNCNKGIGHFRDDIAYLEKAIRYLERHAAKAKSAPASNVIHLKTKER